MTRELKNLKEIPIYDLVTAYGVELKRHSTNQWVAPCPSCGGNDRFVVNEQTNMWYCHRHENGHRSAGDTIEFVMLMEGCDFLAACSKLESGTIQASTLVKTYTPARDQSARASTFDTAYWQNMVDKNAHYMNSYSAQGKYLLQRGISIATAKEFRLGGSYAHGELAIAIPYYDFNGSLVGGKWRIINPTENKYHVWKGSNVRYGFGWHALKGSDILFIVEGELNAVSIRESDPDIDALSMGSECSFIPSEVAKRLNHYNNIILWADSDKAIERWTSGLPNYTQTFITVTKKGIKYDANECLRRNGLDNVLHRILTGTLGKSKAYIQQIQNW